MSLPSIDERFNVAVEIIENLPRNISFHSYNSKLLLLYGLYKQATCGSCEDEKPFFWDLANRAKHRAWRDQRKLSKQQAKIKYLKELEKLVFSMSKSAATLQEFITCISGGNGKVDFDKLDLIVPGMRALAETHLPADVIARFRGDGDGAGGVEISVSSADPTPSAADSLAESDSPSSSKSRGKGENLKSARRTK